MYIHSLCGMNSTLRYGIDNLLQDTALLNKRLTLVTNDAACSSSGVISRVALLEKGFNIVQLFSPEHGISTAGEDGVKQDHHTDLLTGLPVYSLYGSSLQPGLNLLQHTDAVLYDIPGIGCRFYTYLWTMTLVMEVCAAAGIPFIVLDRPDPTGALLQHAEGPWLDEVNCASFIGRWNIPVRYCCTTGELARYFAATRLPGLSLQVIPCTSYHRAMTAERDFDFTPTSPAIQTIESAFLYPGMCLLEGLNINEGRGTGFPFQCCGAPWIQSGRLLQKWKEKQVAGLHAEAGAYNPSSGLYAGTTCYGLKFTITDSSQLQPVRAGLSLLASLMELYPGLLKERAYPTVANPDGSGHLDKLLGIPGSFQLLREDILPDPDVNPRWAISMNPYLLYP